MVRIITDSAADFEPFELEKLKADFISSNVDFLVLKGPVIKDKYPHLVLFSQLYGFHNPPGGLQG